MRDVTDVIVREERTSGLKVPDATPQQEIWTVQPRPQRCSNFESVLLAIAGHDLRQPLQVVQSAHELLGMGIRTSSELRHLRTGQDAIDRLKGQLAQLQTALRIREHTKGVDLSLLCLNPILKQACRDNEEAALRKGICLRMVPTDQSIMSDGLLLGAALGNLVSNAVKYTEPGGRILVGCRRSGSNLRIDIYDTGIGIRRDQMPKIFGAFTRLDTPGIDGLGIGLFIVRHALAVLGHRIEVASSPSRGSRFSIFAPLQKNGHFEQSARTRQFKRRAM
ncbi:sensor histidine kinase [Bradyrhizobium canariense]|uniref:sensor histidine kinase n=1 Tax=Bradyrhizobium canariense TaxID=255045 RepID=UPI000A198BA5|nr:HAMP domain-containing sensor histidine kinase [Bradyrhizobium canariense]OSI20505.1 hypothetical protein BST65_32570 [Bradyrhizobium canariense]OSI33423.1 hypothetical protein BST66_13540 [Bradyrhizobium canariense]OSI39643.1 hypothetical protein BSZ20_29405 [Bradyrhizobium canariense]OSI47666.1 hypothetical protein BST67_19885 [Bradyrhizobium canariense]OSI56010.1 hypothetical protein BSZ15_18385 [Bradyrhizobium canariense]